MGLRPFWDKKHIWKMSKNKTKTKIRRVSVTLTEEHAARLEKKAEEQLRTLSNMLSHILTSEDKRQDAQSELNFNNQE